MNISDFKGKTSEELKEALFKMQDDEVLQHTISIAPNFKFSPQKFYEMVERELTSHKMPGLEISRKEHSEGGAFSAKRIYLRLIRERLAFDACAAPFGDDYFFSCRTVYSPVRIKLWHVFVVLGILGGLFCTLQKPLGMDYAAIAVAAFVLAVGMVFRNTVAAGFTDLDALLIKTPAIGPIYERWFRKDTYYRQDTRLMYLELVPKLIENVIKEITAEGGINLVRQYERAPILDGLYKPSRAKQSDGH